MSCNTQQMSEIRVSGKIDRTAFPEILSEEGQSRSKKTSSASKKKTKKKQKKNKKKGKEKKRKEKQ